jgi:Protein of unknown function (DUF2934)
MSNEVSDQESVRLLAYQFWMERGCPVGSPEVDWEKAQELLRTAHHASAQVSAQQGAAPAPELEIPAPLSSTTVGTAGSTRAAKTRAGKRATRMRTE